MKNVRSVHTLLSIVMLLITFAVKAQQKEKQPNIILIMTDDQGWFDVGFNGNNVVKTPHLDAMASRGVIFDRFYSASAVCSPTRASFITGRNPLRTDVPYANSGHLRQGEITISELLKKEGYATGHFGKWHLGTLTTTEPDANRGGKAKFVDEYTIPSEHGYDEFFCTESKVPTYDPMVNPVSFKEDESKHFGWRAVEGKSAVQSYGTAYWTGENIKAVDNLEGDNSRVIMDRVLPFIEKATKQERSFFTTVWLHTPHLPVVTDKEHRDMYKDLSLEEQLYYGSITAMDEQIGRLWETLKKLDITEETIIFFCSDNGPEVKTPGSAGIYKGKKRSLHEGGVRVPAFAIWHGTWEAGKRTAFPMVTSDYLPTLIDILDIDYPDDRPVDGISLLDAINGKAEKRNEAIGFICNPKMSWVTDQYKLIRDMKGQNFELYDLHNDPSEENNILTKEPELASKMKAELANWLTSVNQSREGRDYK